MPMILSCLELYLQYNSLAEDLSLIEIWCGTNSMTVNVIKSGVMHFGKKNPNHNYLIGNSVIPCLSTYKDPGIIVDPTLSFTTHISALAKKAFWCTKLLLKSIGKSNIPMIVSMFRTYVLPMLTYGIPFFFPCTISCIDKLENIQRHFTKILLRTNPHAQVSNYATRLSLLDMVPIEVIFLKISLNYLFKLVHTPSPLKYLLPPSNQSLTRSSPHSFIIPMSHLYIHKFIFPNNVLHIWNSLPDHILSASSPARFHQAFDVSSFLKGRALKTL